MDENQPFATPPAYAFADARRRGLPHACYTSAEFHRWEAANLLHAGWHFVGRAEQLAQPGAYRVLDIAGASVVLVRGEDGALRALSNVCRHRGTRLLDDEGRCDRIRCPFHGWTYALDGRLVGAPSMQRVDGFSSSGHALAPLRLESALGLCFVNIDGAAPPLAQWLGSFAEVHAPWSLADMRVTRRARYEVGCNWKAFIEVFMEYYHLPVVHPETFARTGYQPADEQQLERGYISLFGTHEGTGAVVQDDAQRVFDPIPGLGGRSLLGSRYTQIYPSTILCCTRDCMWVYECYPQGPDRSVFYMNVCFPASTVVRADFDAIVAAYYTRWDVALAEDIVVLERQHRGLQSGASWPGLDTRGPLCELEAAVGHFAEWIAERAAGDGHACGTQFAGSTAAQTLSVAGSRDR